MAALRRSLAIDEVVTYRLNSSVKWKWILVGVREEDQLRIWQVLLPG